MSKTAWSAWCLICLSMAAALLPKAGVEPRQWQWSALGISVAALFALAGRGEQHTARRLQWDLYLLGALLAWMAFQMIPLPPGLVQALSPERWSAAAAAREMTGRPVGAWLQISANPTVSFFTLVKVLPAMAAFVAARQLSLAWRDRIWLLLAPVLALAWLESLLGIAQFGSMRSSADIRHISGTFINPNHFAGLLEMSFPLVLMWAAAIYRKRTGSGVHSPRTALQLSVLLGVGACLLAAITMSRSRMGFVSTLAALWLMAALLLSSNAQSRPRRRRRLWLVLSIALPVCLLVFLPTPELLSKFASSAVQEDGRLSIWKYSLRVIASYPYTGCGLGAFESGSFFHKDALPMNSVKYAHNDYLQILAELGAAGFLLMGILVGRVLFRLSAFVLSHRESQHWETAAGLLGGLLALSAHSLADFNLYVPVNALVAAWLMGAASTLGVREREE